MIVQNAVICNKCDDFIFSKHRHDFVTCKCGSISVDGGQEYLRRVGGLREKTNDGRPPYTDLSWEIPDVVYRDCAVAAKDAIDTGRNAIGIANAVMRKLREADLIVANHEPRIMATYNDELMVTEPDGTVNRYKRIV